MYSARQEHTAWSLTTWQRLFGPQGDGEHGSPLSSITTKGRVVVELSGKTIIGKIRKEKGCSLGPTAIG